MLLWKCALLGEEARWNEQSKWMWEKPEDLSSTCIGMYHLDDLGRVLMKEMDEVILESIDVAYVGNKPITGDARRIVITI